jgi:hypothetical protein
VDLETLTEWGTENSGLLGEARRKITNLGVTGAALDSYIDSLAQQFLRGENSLATLRSKYPSSWSLVSTLKSDKEMMLALEYPPGSTTSGMDVRAIVQDVSAEIERDVPAVSGKLAKVFAWSMVADWILRCPLEFEEQST